MNGPRTSRLPLVAHRCVVRAERALRAAGVGHEPVLLGVSGGSDSMALLQVTSMLAPPLVLTLHVACIDHGLRSEAAGESRLVRETAESLGARFHAERIDPGRGSEDELRDARHAALLRIARANACRFVLLAHTADDQVETIVMRFLRGAGLGGLAGMRPVRAPFVRPLLDCRRDELRELLGACGLAWAEDASNASPRYARGRLRTLVLPAIEAAFGKGALAHLLDVAPRWRVDEDFLEREASRLLAAAGRLGERGGELDLDELAAAHPALRARALRAWILGRTGRTIPSRELAGIERWLDDGGGRGGLDLAGLRLERRDRRLRLGSPAAGPTGSPRVDSGPSSGEIPKDSAAGTARAPGEGVLPPSHGRVRVPRNS